MSDGASRLSSTIRMSSDLVIGWISWALTLISNVRYNFGRRSPWDSGHQEDVAYTPFTGAFWAVWIFWIILEVAQVTYLGNYFYKSGKPLQWNFTVGNLLLLFWSYLFSRGHYFFSLIVIALAHLNAITAYLINQSWRLRPLKVWLGAHGTVAALPLAWTNYVILWNGAVLFHARNWPSRILANILIWELLVVPGFFLLAFGDYTVGLAFAWLAFALAVGQITTKIFALQWIFAFIIAAILFVVSFVYSLSPPNNVSEGAPLLAGDRAEGVVDGP